MRGLQSPQLAGGKSDLKPARPAECVPSVTSVTASKLVQFAEYYMHTQSEIAEQGRTTAGKVVG